MRIANKIVDDMILLIPKEISDGSILISPYKEEGISGWEIIPFKKGNINNLEGDLKKWISEAIQKAIDIETDDTTTTVYFPFTMLGKASEILKVENIDVVAQPQGTYKPSITVQITDSIGENLDTLITALEGHDDIQDVFHNAV
jgi:transcriptional/translational regulatory protein YebC/TACO1